MGRRARRVETGKLTVIDDCYNANPTSTASAIRSLAAGEGRKVCILGDMLELGEDAEQLHYETGALAASAGIDLVLTTGELSRQTAEGAGQPEHWFESRDALCAALPDLLRDGDSVLVKASHSMHFEEITAVLEAM